MTKQVIVARYWPAWNGCNIVCKSVDGYVAGPEVEVFYTANKEDPFAGQILKLEAFDTYREAYAHWVKLNNKLDAAESLLWT